MPSPPHRAALNRLTGWSEVDLWPQLARRPEPDEPRSEVLTVYGRRSLVPARVWHELFANATASIDIVAYSCLFLAEDADVQRLLRERTQNGVRVRIALGDPEGRNVAQRGVDQGIDDIMASHVRHALLLYRSLATEPGVELRLHDTVLYSSIYRADDDLLVNLHSYGCAAAQSPVLHLRRSQDDGMAATYLESVERIWAAARPIRAGKA